MKRFVIIQWLVFIFNTIWWLLGFEPYGLVACYFVLLVAYTGIINFLEKKGEM